MANVLQPIVRPLVTPVVQRLDAALSKGGGAASFASGPAPSGFRWDFVTRNGERVTLDSEPVVALVRAA